MTTNVALVLWIYTAMTVILMLIGGTELHGELSRRSPTRGKRERTVMFIAILLWPLVCIGAVIWFLGVVVWWGVRGWFGK